MAQISPEDRFNLEVVKLLLKIAWVDNEVDEREKQTIVGAARSWNVPEPELKQLLTRLEQGAPLPEPDLALLRPRADDVMTAARALVLSDGKVKKEESALLKQLAASLA
ncbi:MAG: TerB family tellurite resistance protein [Archangiaceae bacterium]|nr:TerB family tellurite resistance protein [Archangiaceae bacterium]